MFPRGVSWAMRLACEGQDNPILSKGGLTPKWVKVAKFADGLICSCVRVAAAACK